ncbi:MAG TPA: hypothetical protein VFE62_17930 [Gemmataceae bacterium]|nr:hypothetical protein [Gemmataceae bacterium]
MYRLALSALFVLGLFVTGTTAQFKDKDVKDGFKGEPKKTVSTYPKVKARAVIPGEVDINFLNGSTVRMIIQSEKLEIATTYGKLSVPVKDVRAVEFGLHFPEGMEGKIEAAVKGLGSGDYRTREKAGAELVDLGPFSYPAIVEATHSTEPEIAQRAKELAKKMQASFPKKDLKTTVDDKIVTKAFTIVGRIQTPTVKAKTEYFGDIELGLAKMRTLRAVGGTGLDMEFAIDASKYANHGQWMDTGYQVDGRTAIQITAKGLIDIWPQQGGQYLSNPNGWQATQRGGMMPAMGLGRKIGMVNQQQHSGMLLGKIGEDGEIFVVGERYDGTPDHEGKLMLHIGPSQWGGSAGTYDVKIVRKE